MYNHVVTDAKPCLTMLKQDTKVVKPCFTVCLPILSQALPFWNMTNYAETTANVNK